MKGFAFFFLILSHAAFGQALHWKTVELGVNTNCRGLSVVNDSVAWISGSNGWVGRSTNGGASWDMKQVKDFEKVDFRCLYAFNAQTAIIANAGSPANILFTTNGGKNWKIVYTNNDTSAFFDGIDFWNDKEGMIYGDPIRGRMMLLRTGDGGLHWEELPDSCRPVLSRGEASFAASGTGIRCVEKQKVIITTGGKVSALLISNDKGQAWMRVQTPIIQGLQSTGIFSVAYVNKNRSIIVGGDYLVDTSRSSHVFYTKDGGKQWVSPSFPTRGYRECVEYLGKKNLMATGPTGTDISFDYGKTWFPFSDEQNFHVVRKARNGKLIILAGKGKVGVILEVVSRKS
jgi:photosystem II stability/assembly factor-like uncharacterized protein